MTQKYCRQPPQWSIFSLTVGAGVVTAGVWPPHLKGECHLPTNTHYIFLGEEVVRATIQALSFIMLTIRSS